MPSQMRRYALLTVAGGLTLSLGLATPAAAATEWGLQYKLDREEENRFTDVDAAAGDAVWAVGWVGPWDDTRPVAFRYDGNSWRDMGASHAGTYFTGVDATTTGSAWVAANDPDGADDAVLHWDRGWHTYRFPSSGGDVAAISDQDVWFVSGTASGQGLARHYDGNSWRTTQLPGAGPDYITDVEARSSKDVWAVGSRDDQPYAAHWNGKRWRLRSPAAVTPPPGDDEYSSRLTGVGFVGRTAWAIGIGTGDTSADGLLYRLRGKKWTPVALPEMRYSVAASDVGTGPNGKLWLAGQDSNLMYRKTKKGWTEVALPEEPRTATSIAAFSSTGSKTWAVGIAETTDFSYHGVIYHGSTS